MLVDLVARLRALPRKKNEVWQGGPVRLPLWTSPEPGGTPIRPWSVWWANAVRTELADDRVESAKRDDITLEAALEAMVKFAESFRPQGCRPESIKTNDAAFAAAAKPVLAAADVDVQLVERLPFLDDAIKKATLTEQNDDRAGVMSAKGMTLDRVRGLADAAAEPRAGAVCVAMVGGDVILATLSKRADVWVLKPSSGTLITIADDVEVWAIVQALVRTNV